LKVNKTLRILHLDCNEIGVKGAAALAAALAENKTLELLNVEHNGLSKESVEELKKAKASPFRLLVNDQSVIVTAPPPEDDDTIPPPPPPPPPAPEKTSTSGEPVVVDDWGDDFLALPQQNIRTRRESLNIEGVQEDFNLRDNPLLGKAGKTEEKGTPKTYRTYKPDEGEK